MAMPQTSYGQKQTARVLTVDRDKRRVELALRDGGSCYAAVWETQVAFRWPKTGELWTIRKDNNIWRLEGMVDQQSQDQLSSDKPISELQEGETRILGDRVYANVATFQTIVSDRTTTEILALDSYAPAHMADGSELNVALASGTYVVHVFVQAAAHEAKPAIFELDWEGHDSDNVLQWSRACETKYLPGTTTPGNAALYTSGSEFLTVPDGATWTIRPMFYVYGTWVSHIQPGDIDVGTVELQYPTGSNYRPRLQAMKIG